MGQYNAAVLTTAGQALIASAIAQETPLIFTKMRTSSTVIPAGTNLENLTSLSGTKQSVDITSTLLYDSQTIQISANFPNTQISTAYYVQTIGAYGKITGGAETLIAVCTAISPDEMPVYDPDSPASIIYKVQLRYANAEAVTLVVNDTGTASVEDLSLKVSKAGGDIAETVVSAVTPSTASYPTISAGDTVKVIAGKVNKSISDLEDNKVDTNGGFIGATLVGSIAYVATAYTPIDVMDTFAEAVGKINASFEDTAEKLPLKLDADKVANDLVTLDPGFALDARQGRVLNNKVSKIGNYEVVLSVTAASGYFIAQNASLYLCIIADGGTSAVWICAKKATAAAGLSQIYNNSGNRFSASVSDDVVTIESAQYGAIILAIKLA